VVVLEVTGGSHARVLLDFEENNRFEGNNYKVHARDLAASGLSIRAKCIYKSRYST